ncbi:MAG TPA: poly(3-hydroxybutyrate) depolymerase [Janthinobacterium sp.]|nr:poly(3-hydroxybutyrate) depolymerase [Janthinobacterium sp.]
MTVIKIRHGIKRKAGILWIMVLAGLLLYGVHPSAAMAKAKDPAALPALQVDLSQTSVSGLSSGAYMAGQFAVAYSAIVIGAGLIAGGPYYCSGTVGIAPYIPYLSNAMSTCMNPDSAHVAPPLASASWSAANIFSRDGAIDPTSNVAKQRIYLFSGSDDQTVTRPVVDQARRFYQLAGVPEGNIRYVITYHAGHAFITDKNGDQACPLTAPPYINDCDYPQAHDLLNHIYQNLQPPSARLSGKIVKFNQRSYARDAFSSMSNTAYAYVPASCASQTCRVHIAFHGCYQGAAAIGDHFYARAGYNEVADANNIVVLYPQAEPSPVYPYNPRGCWDFWGYTSVNPFLPDFYLKSGTQMAAVKAMLDRLAAPRGSH